MISRYFISPLFSHAVMCLTWMVENFYGKARVFFFFFFLLHTVIVMYIEFLSSLLFLLINENPRAIPLLVFFQMFSLSSILQQGFLLAVLRVRVGSFSCFSNSSGVLRGHYRPWCIYIVIFSKYRIALKDICSGITTFFLISLSLGETLLLEPFDGKVYDLLPVFLPELLSCPSNHLCLAPIFWLVFLSLSFRLS